MDPNPEYQLLRLILLRSHQRRRQQRSYWFRPILLRREQNEEDYTLVREMQVSDPAAHHRYFRTSVKDFDEILAQVSDTIQKQPPNIRDPISPGERLAVTLRSLAAGGTMKSIAESFRIGYATIRKIVPEVSDAIWSELGPKVMTFTSLSHPHLASIVILLDMYYYYYYWSFGGAATTRVIMRPQLRQTVYVLCFTSDRCEM